MESVIQNNPLIDKPVRVVRPNLLKIFFRNMIIIIVAVLLFIGLLLYIQVQIGLDSFSAPLLELGFQIDAAQVIVYTILIIVFGSALLLLGNYLANKSVRYEFYDGKVKVYETQVLVIITSKVISFDNIIKINYVNNGLMNKILDYGDISITLSGTGNSEQLLKYLDNVVANTEYFQQLLGKFNAMKQYRVVEEQKIQNIVSRF